MRAAATLFVLTGLVSATWAARIPGIQEQLGLSPGALGLAVLGLEGGGIVGLPAGGALVARRGSRAVLRAGFAAYPLALVAVALAPGLAALAAGLACMAFANSLVDVAMNVHGVELERRAGRPLMSRLHAGHAFGVLAGGLVGTAAATAGVGMTAHFTVVAALAAVAGQAALAVSGASTTAAPARPRRGGRDDAGGLGAGAARALFAQPLALLGAVAFCAFLLDGSAYAWIAVHLRGEGAPPGLAAAGFTVFALALTVGRLLGDRAQRGRGRAALVRGGAALATAGIAFALLAPAPPLALAGWAAFGAGLAPIAPAVLGAAPTATPLPAPHAIAAVTTVGYLGSFTGPPLIGALAGPVGLTAALGVMAAAGLTAALLASPALRAARRSAPPAPPPARPASSARSPAARPPAARGAPATPPAPPARAPATSPRRG
jgi:MFS family permease